VSVWGALGFGALFLALMWWNDLTRKRNGRECGDAGVSGGDDGGDCGGGDGGGD
jgi:hypothetical protein